MLKKAMIMAAGVGSRLESLSSALPKPIVPLANVPVMDIITKHLSSFGIIDIIANTHYKAEYIKNHYKDKKYGVNYSFIEEKELSGTAGGLKKCQFFFDKDSDFIVMSGDGLSDIDINKAYESHKKSGSIATLVLKEVPKNLVSIYGIVVPDKNNYVESFQEKPPASEAKSNLANTGIYIFNYKIFDYIPENTFFDFAKNVFPLLLSDNQKINTFIHKGYWSDIGSINQYKLSNFDLLNHKIKSFIPDVIKTEKGIYCCGENVQIDNTAEIIGNCVIGNGCKIGKNVKIIDSIIWNNIIIEKDIIIEDSIILNNLIVQENLKNEILSEDKIKAKENIKV